MNINEIYQLPNAQTHSIKTFSSIFLQQVSILKINFHK